jgi:hypothetical protein
MKAFFLLLLAGIVVGLPSAHMQNPPARVIDINGLWKDRNRLVGIGQTDTTVVAMFKQPYTKCDPQNGSPPQDRVKNFEGTISGKTITGMMTVCNYGKSWGAKAGIQEVSFRLTISDDQNTLSGTYDGWKGPENVTLTRECTPDPRNLCDAIGKAIQRTSAALTAQPSTSNYQNLQQSVGEELGTIRNNLCDKPETADQLDVVQQNLNSLNYVPGQSNSQNNLALVRIEAGLKELSNSQCSAFNPPPPPPPCAEGSVVKTDGDASFLNSFKTRLEVNLQFNIWGGLSQTKACLSKMFDERCAPGSFVNDVKAGAESWDNGLRPTLEFCQRMCNSLGAWYESSTCEGGFETSKVVERCTFTCRNNNFYPQ